MSNESHFSSNDSSCSVAGCCALIALPDTSGAASNAIILRHSLT